MAGQSKTTKKKMAEVCKGLLAELSGLENLASEDNFTAFTAQLKEVMVEIKESREERKQFQQTVDTLTKENAHLKSEVEFLKQATANQQRFLEMLDGDKRACNLILTGVSESDIATATTDEEKVSLIMSEINADPYMQSVESIQRLGELKPEATRPRPVKIVLKNRRARKPILEKAKDLKQSAVLGGVYIKKDTHPAFRKEMGRLREAEKRERDRPENQGQIVRYDKEQRVLLVGDVIVDRYNPSLF